MYTFDVSPLGAGSTSRYQLCDDHNSLRWSEVVERWCDEKAFRTFFISLLKNAPYSAYFWETPPVSSATYGREFEFVLVDSKALTGIHANPSAFANQFQTVSSDASVVQFKNLGGDAMLVVPCPRTPVSAYAHLHDFTHQAPIDQQHEFWKQTGDAIQNCLAAEPIWVSTSGLGVFWLHVRLDSAPKYYTHNLYRNSS